MLIMNGLIIFALTLTNICYAANEVCNTSELDQRLAPIIGIFGLKEHKFPENEQQLDQYCRSFPGYVSSAKTFVQNCLKGLSKTISSVTIFSADKVITKQICNNKVERNNFISRAKCGNKGKKNTSKCWNKLITNMSNVRNMTESKMKLPSLCCALFDWKTCTLNAYNSIGQPLCDQKVMEHMDQHISRGALDAMNLFCSDLDDESDKCVNVMKQIPKTKVNRLRTKTFIPAIIEIFNTL